MDKGFHPTINGNWDYMSLLSLFKPIILTSPANRYLECTSTIRWSTNCIWSIIIYIYIYIYKQYMVNSWEKCCVHVHLPSVLQPIIYMTISQWCIGLLPFAKMLPLLLNHSIHHEVCDGIVYLFRKRGLEPLFLLSTGTSHTHTEIRSPISICIHVKWWDTITRPFTILTTV